MQLELTATEASVLADVLENSLGALREEVYKAEVSEYKAALKERERIIVSLLARARGAVS